MRLDPAAWAQVHDRPDAGSALFRRGLELCLAECAPRVRPGDLWVDAGSGTGHLAAALAAHGARVVACDRDPRMAAYARHRWRRGAGARPAASQDTRTLDAGAAFYAADVAALALPDACCNGMAAVSLLGYLPDPAAFFTEAARVLAPGATLCLTAMNRGSLLLVVAKALGWRRRFTQARFTAHAPPSLTAALGTAGFTVDRQLFYGHHLAIGPLTIPSVVTARRREHQAPPGARSRWARQFLLVARRLDRPAP
jgi:SAM-dependent methyltransferase